MGAAASVDTVQAYYSEVERVVPRTPRGSRDLKRCDRDGLKEVICRATPFVKQLYDDAWTTYAAADDLRETTAALEATFSPRLFARSYRALKAGALPKSSRLV